MEDLFTTKKQQRRTLDEFNRQRVRLLLYLHDCLWTLDLGPWTVGLASRTTSISVGCRCLVVADSLVMDASDHMLDPQWEPETTPNRDVGLSPYLGYSFARNPRVKQLTALLTRGQFSISNESCRSFCSNLEQEDSVPGLEHVRFQPDEEDAWEDNPMAIVPSLALVTVSHLAQVNTVTFSNVGIAVANLKVFLKETNAHTLRFYHCSLLDGNNEYPQLAVAEPFTVSSSVKFLDLRRVFSQSAAVGALLNGVLSNCKNIASCARITVNPEDMAVHTFGDSVGSNWAGCQILELSDDEGDFDCESTRAIFQSMSRNQDYRFSNVQELRLTNPLFTESSFEAFFDYATNSHHLLSIRIRGWTKFLELHVPGAHWDMMCLIRVLKNV